MQNMYQKYSSSCKRCAEYYGCNILLDIPFYTIKDANKNLKREMIKLFI